MGEIAWASISDEYELSPGDEVRIRAWWQSDNLYVKAAQWALIERNLEKDHPEFEVLSYTNTDQYLDCEVRVKGTPLLLILLAIGIIVGPSIFAVMWAFKDHETMLKVVAQTAYAQTTTAKIEAAKWPIIVLAAAAAFVFGVLKLKK